MAQYKALLEVDDENWQWHHDIVLRHAHLAVTLGGKAMADGGGGVMAFVASVSGISSAPLHGAYGVFKAGLMSLVRTAAVELHRRQREAVCVALHPGTVETRLSSRFGKHGLEVQTPAVAAARMLRVIDRLRSTDSGSFLDQHGQSVPW